MKFSFVRITICLLLGCSHPNPHSSSISFYDTANNALLKKEQDEYNRTHPGKNIYEELTDTAKPGHRVTKKDTAAIKNGAVIGVDWIIEGAHVNPINDWDTKVASDERSAGDSIIPLHRYPFGISSNSGWADTMKPTPWKRFAININTGWATDSPSPVHYVNMPPVPPTDLYGEVTVLTEHVDRMTKEIEEINAVDRNFILGFIGVMMLMSTIYFIILTNQIKQQ